MGLRLTGMVMAALLLAACGDGASEQPAEVTGVLQAGGVNGVHYATPTRSGETDASGTFKYLPGETVTFSIGGYELGSARGAAAITAFTLAGLTPPTTELALRRELEKARRTSSNFVRAVNIARLLLALDSDSNPANGIDLQGRIALINSTTPDLNLSAAEFALKLEQSAPDLTRNIPLWYPVAYLYRAMSIAVPAHLETRIDTSEDGGFPPTAFQSTYGADGSLHSQSTDYGADGVIDSEYGWTYDGLGRTLSFIGNQPPFGRAAYGYVFDARGNYTGGSYESDSDGDGKIDYRQSDQRTVDASGYTLSLTRDTDSNADGMPEIREATQVLRDASGRNETYNSQIDYGVDGSVESRGTGSATYDASKRLLSYYQAFDNDADGKLDQSYRYSFEYAATGGATRQVFEEDYDGNGVVDSGFVYSTTYDAAGNPTVRLTEEDFDADGTIDYRTRTDSTFDAAGRELTQQQRSDQNADGVYESGNTTRNTFDDLGNTLVSTWELDYELDGVADQFVLTKYEYGSSGEELGFRSGPDDNRDGEVDSGTTSIVTHTVLPDGVLALAQQYLSN